VTTQAIPIANGNGTAADDWLDANQRYLTAALAVLRRRLARTPDDGGGRDARGALADAASAAPPPAAEALRAAFGLTPFEHDLLLLCAGCELDAALAEACRQAQPGLGSNRPTFGLALGALPDAHWSALSPGRPLRRFHLIEVVDGEVLTSSPMRIDERVLHFLLGVHDLDRRLHGLVETIDPPGGLPASHQGLVEEIAATWMSASSRGRLPMIELLGPDPDSKRAVAAAACERLGLRLNVLNAQLLGPSVDDTLAALLLSREAMLTVSALLVDCEDLEPTDAGTAPARRLIERVLGPLFVARRDRGPQPRRAVVSLEVRRPTAAEQRAAYHAALATHSGESPVFSERAVERAAEQFDLGTRAIRTACAEAVRRGRADPDGALWESCRAQGRVRLDELAQRILPVATWDDLVLPARQRDMLHDIAIRVRQRARVYDGWGFRSRSARGLGVSALFSGPSGTGKTTAAEVLANELHLDLYRVDLSQVVSKYIGETEKNLRRVFDAAESGSGILLFDEADALFGKRSEVKDSHDRYANIEVGYLLQRMEAYRGLAILTTNMKGALDDAFMRRLAFVVEFPFPGPEERAEIWRRVFPSATPVEGMDVPRLARLNLAGGSIRNVALGAAFLAADADEPVRMKHIAAAVEREFDKQERSLPDDFRRA